MSPTFYISEFDTTTTLSVSGEFLDAPVEPGWDVQIDCSCGWDFFSSTYNMIYDGSLNNPLTDQESEGRNVEYVTDEDNLSELFMQIIQYSEDATEAGNFFNLRIRTRDASGNVQTGTRGKSSNSDEDSLKRRTGTGEGEGELDFEKARGASIGFDFLRYMSYRLFRTDYGILFENNIEVQENIETNFLYSLKWAILNGSIEGELASLKTDTDSTYNLGQAGENGVNSNIRPALLKNWMIEQTMGLSGEFIDWLPTIVYKQAPYAEKKVYRDPKRSYLDTTDVWDNRGSDRGQDNQTGTRFARVLYKSPASKTLFSSIAKTNPERFGNLGPDPDDSGDRAVWAMDALWDYTSEKDFNLITGTEPAAVYEQKAKTRIGAPLMAGDKIVMHMKVKMQDDQVSGIYGDTHEIDTCRVYRIVFHLQESPENIPYLGRDADDWPYLPDGGPSY